MSPDRSFGDNFPGDKDSETGRVFTADTSVALISAQELIEDCAEHLRSVRLIGKTKEGRDFFFKNHWPDFYGVVFAASIISLSDSLESGEFSYEDFYDRVNYAFLGTGLPPMEGYMPKEYIGRKSEVIDSETLSVVRAKSAEDPSLSFYWEFSQDFMPKGLGQGFMIQKKLFR